MTCPNCGYDRWDGKTPHPYAGRESAGVRCFGPKTLGTPVVPVGKKPLPARKTKGR